MQFLQGKKSYLVAAAMVIVGAAEALGFIPYGVGTALGLDGSGAVLLMNGLGVAALRAGIKKAES